MKVLLDRSSSKSPGYTPVCAGAIRRDGKSAREDERRQGREGIRGGGREDSYD
jgi:hypothetical protein